jgi:hypothetical protein
MKRNERKQTSNWVELGHFKGETQTAIKRPLAQVFKYSIISSDSYERLAASLLLLLPSRRA